MTSPTAPTPPPKPSSDTPRRETIKAGPVWLGLFVILIVVINTVIYLQSDGTKDIVIPAFNPLEQKGGDLFTSRCATCHGAHAAGSDSGPTLIHRYYEPNLHGDSTFYDAIRHGSQAHHWNFGDMPPVNDLGNEDIAAIVAYVRRLQQANGIHWQ
jgi:mono/diheme cytochrome c family protein